MMGSRTEAMEMNVEKENKMNNQRLFKCLLLQQYFTQSDSHCLIQKKDVFLTR
jgi:hypothetical protein